MANDNVTSWRRQGGSGRPAAHAVVDRRPRPDGAGRAWAALSVAAAATIALTGCVSASGTHAASAPARPVAVSAALGAQAGVATFPGSTSAPRTTGGATSDTHVAAGSASDPGSVRSVSAASVATGSVPTRAAASPSVGSGTRSAQAAASSGVQSGGTAAARSTAAAASAAPSAASGTSTTVPTASGASVAAAGSAASHPASAAASAALSSSVTPPQTPITMIGTPAWVPLPSTPASSRGKGISPGGLYQTTINTMSASNALAVFTDMRSTGASWVRLDYNYAGTTTGHGGSSIQTIQEARAAGLQVSVILGDGTAPMPESAGYRAANGWLTASVKQLAGLGVHTFEVGNEANLGVNWGTGTADPAAYTTLLKTVYPIIHAADPQAVVLTAGMAPYGKESPTHSAQGSNYHPFDFVAQMYADGAHGSFDALNLHPYTYPTMPAVSDGGYNMLSVLPDLIATMTAHGDGSKPIWWTEAGLPTGADGGYQAYTVAQQQQTITQLFQVAAKYPQVGPVFLYDWQDGGSDGDFGLYTTTHVEKASHATFAAVSY